MTELGWLSSAGQAVLLLNLPAGAGDPIGSFPPERGRGRVTAMNPARRQATYEDLLKVPDILIAEIIDGELNTSPRPASPHARATSVIRGDLDPFDRRPGSPGGPGGWWILFEPELHLGADILVPDLAGWRRGKYSRRAVRSTRIRHEPLVAGARGVGGRNSRWQLFLARQKFPVPSIF